jgi:hypothetical protein
MNDRRSRAERMRQKYNQFSTQYHNTSHKCEILSQILANATRTYTAARIKYNVAQANYDESERAFVAHSLSYRKNLAQYEHELEVENVAEADRQQAKKRFWEMSDMEQKYVGLSEKLEAEVELLTKRHEKKSQESQRLVGDIETSETQVTDLKQKSSDAKSAAESFKRDFKEQGCGSPDEITNGPKAEDGQTAPADGRTSDDTSIEQDQTPGADDDTQRSQSGSSESMDEVAESTGSSGPANKAMYDKIYQKFLGDYKKSAATAEDLAAESKSLLGDEGYTQCQYLTKLVSMYTDVSNQNTEYKDWYQSHGDMNDPNQLKNLLNIEQKASLDDERASHFKKKMENACRKGKRVARSTEEDALRSKAEQTRQSAMVFLQLSASESSKAASRQFSSVRSTVVKSDDDLDKKMRDTLETYCSKQKELTLASLAAVEAADIALQKHSKYLDLARESQEAASQAAVDVSNRRHALRRKIQDYTEYAKEAATAKLSPCEQTV